jgi:hypothetical protein
MLDRVWESIKAVEVGRGTKCVYLPGVILNTARTLGFRKFVAWTNLTAKNTLDRVEKRRWEICLTGVGN